MTTQHTTDDRTSIGVFYKFAQLDDLPALRSAWLEHATGLGLKGTILLASEGINGALAGPRAQVDAMIDTLRTHPALTDLVPRYNSAGDTPFRRMKVKLKREIVSLGVAGIDPASRTGTRVSPAQWNALIRDPATTVIDTRNDYEYRLGTFEGAVNPSTANFREFPRYVADRLGDDRARPIAMFCTGGIRCEKASAMLLAAGFENVYQLEGGILHYLEQTDTAQSTWRGDLFVFDERVAIDAALNPADYEQCPGCRRPVGAAERSAPGYERGVSCPSCHAELSERARRGFRERAHQVKLAATRGQRHLGADMAAADVSTDERT